jgi:hypothetical protein
VFKTASGIKYLSKRKCKITKCAKSTKLAFFHTKINPAIFVIHIVATKKSWIVQFFETAKKQEETNNKILSFHFALFFIDLAAMNGKKAPPRGIFPIRETP